MKVPACCHGMPLHRAVLAYMVLVWALRWCVTFYATSVARSRCSFLLAAVGFEMSCILAECAGHRLSSLGAALVLRMAKIAAVVAYRGAIGPRGSFSLMGTSLSSAFAFPPLATTLGRPRRRHHWRAPVIEQLLVRSTWRTCHRCGAVVRVKLMCCS